MAPSATQPKSVNAISNLSQPPDQQLKLAGVTTKTASGPTVKGEYALWPNILPTDQLLSDFGLPAPNI